MDQSKQLRSTAQEAHARIIAAANRFSYGYTMLELNRAARRLARMWLPDNLDEYQQRLQNAYNAQSDESSSY